MQIMISKSDEYKINITKIINCYNKYKRINCAIYIIYMQIWVKPK